MTDTYRLFLAAGTFAIATSLAACDRATDQSAVTTSSPSGESAAPPAAAAAERDNALVRFVHAVPAAPQLDVYADDTAAFQGVEYKAVTPYQEIDGQRYTIRLRPAGQAQGEALASNMEGLDDGDHYTIFALPADNGEPALRVVQDDFTRPAEGKARVRVVHATGGADEIEVVATGQRDPMFDGVDAASVTDYDELDPWAGQLEVRSENGAQALATVPDARFEAGKVYTVVVVGTSAADTRARASGRTPARAAGKVEAFVIEDEMQPIAAAAAANSR